MQIITILLALILALATPFIPLSQATVAVETTKSGPYAGSGTTGPFAYSFKIFAATDLEVIQYDSAGTPTTLTYATDYTVTGVGVTAGGTITLVTALPVGETLVIRRDMSYLQSQNYTTVASITPSSTNNALDKLEMQIQQLAEENSRSFMVPLSSALTGPFNLSPSAGKLIGWNAAGTGLYNWPTTTLSVPVIDHIGNHSDSLTTAVADIGATQQLVLVNKAITMTANVTIPSTMQLFFAEGGLVNLAGFTLTINGAFDAGAYQVFAGTGSVVFGNGREVYPEWWGVTGTNDYIPVQSAIDSITTSTGVVRLLAKTYTLGATGVVVPQYVRVAGAGVHSTTINYSGTGNAFTLGSTSQLNYGCGLSNLRINLTDIAGKGVRLISTAGAVVENLYIEGVYTATRTNQGVTVVSSTSYSSFFNHILNVQCNHMQVGFTVDSGTTLATVTHFTNCQSLGDVGVWAANGSKGYNFGTNSGHGTVITGGNIEWCQYGIYFNTDADPITVTGTRLESNTIDIVFSATSIGSTFDGLKGLDNVSDSSGTGYGQHTFMGCTRSDGTPFTNVLNATILDNQVGVAVIPLKVRGYPSQTADLFQILNSSSGELFTVSSTGAITSAALPTFAGVPEHADNAAAAAAGLTAGMVYRTTDTLKIVH